MLRSSEESRLDTIGLPLADILRTARLMFIAAAVSHS
jgi:hypothetical protein